VKSFDGMIGVRTKYGKGSKFSFCIMLGRDKDYVDYQNQDVKL
jgi:hypothetical protein